MFHWFGRKKKTEESLKASCFQDWLCVYVKRKKKKTFYFNSENQRGYLTDFPFVLLIVLMKPKKPKIFCPFQHGLRSPPCFCALFSQRWWCILSSLLLLSFSLSPFYRLVGLVMSPTGKKKQSKNKYNRCETHLWSDTTGYYGKQVEVHSRNVFFFRAVSVKSYLLAQK